MSLSAQLEVKGKIVDAEGLSIIGANVTLINSSEVGTITDLEGSFVLSANKGDTILVTYVGFQDYKTVVLEQSFLNITLRTDAVALDEVVVTALGVKKAEKSLGYSTQTLTSSSLDKNTDPNFINKLSGQVAGLQVSPSSNGPGGSSRILIRGSSSLTGEDQPIFVIDGIVVSNVGGNGSTANGGIDYGNAISSVNPEDIESITVLKGPGAAALYGSLGQNGAIVITTKSGYNKDNSGISFSTSNTIEQPFIFPQFQNDYGRGARGTFTQFNQDSWGPKYDGRQVTNWKGSEVSYDPALNQMQDFFSYGVNSTNNLEFSGGGEKSNTRVSLSTLRYRNGIPNSRIGRNNASIKNNTSVYEWLKFSAKIDFTNQQGINRPNLAGSPDNPVRAFYIMPRSVLLNDLEPHIDERGLPILWDGRTSGSFDQNPYWSVNLNTNEDIRNRLISFLNVQFDILPWLSGHLRGVADYIIDRRRRQVAENTAYKVSPDASITISQAEIYTGNYDFLLKAKKKWSSINFSLSAGGNRLDQKINSISGFGDALNNPDLYVVNNFVETFSTEGISRKRINSLYLFSDIDYKNFLYLSLTARNDWSSALPAANRSFFYSSANLSWVITDTWENVNFPSFFDFAKLRLSYANVGNDTNPHRLDFIYASSVGHLGQPFTRLPRERPPLDLLPENTNAIEAGVDLRLWKGKLKVDFTYYRSNTFNQIFAAPVASSSGFERALINSGEVQNQGFEVKLSSSVLRNNSPISWDIDLNLSRNNPEVRSLSDDIDRLVLAGSSSGLSIQGIQGSRNDLILGTRLLRNEEGAMILDEFGLPQVEIDEMGNRVFILGHVQPDYMAGLRNTLSYRNLSFGFLIDFQIGGSIYSNSQATGSSRGTLQNTLDGRDGWYKSEEERIALGFSTAEWIPTNGLLVEGVSENGEVVQNNFVDPQRYRGRMSGINENWVYDASFVRLNELFLNFRIPQKISERLRIKQLNLSIFGNNLLFLHKSTPGFTPQASFSSGKSQGIESFAYPAVRSLGLKASINL